MRPRFSIIAINRNGAAFLSRFCRSVAVQTIAPTMFELVFVDDGSTDGSVEIARHFCRGLKNFQVVETGAAKGSGVGGARNAGLKEATGEYVWHVDSDDHLAPDALARIAATLDAFKAANGQDADVCLLPVRSDTPQGPFIRAPQLGELAPQGAVGAWAKVIRQPLCVEFAPGVMLQDRAWHFRQFDRFETVAAVEGEMPVYFYDRTHAAISSAAEWCATHSRTLDELAFGDELGRERVNRRWVGDFFRCVAEMWDTGAALKKPAVRKAWEIRFKLICNNLASGRFSG